MPAGRIAVAMSGGVDSSVAALLLARAGRDVVGVTMRIWEEDPGVKASLRGCCGVRAIRDARRVCAKIGIPHYVLDFREVFEREVIAGFCAEYGRGRTPNPCITCNEKPKFSILLARLAELGAELLATGHHARIVSGTDGTWELRRASDEQKDQTYFLYRLTQEQLGRVLFPVGDYQKEEVRRLAREAGLPVADKPESQEICFVTDDDYAGFVLKRRPELARPGRVVDTAGRELGRHDGIVNFTIGQRKGLGIALGERYYVVRIEPETDTVVLGREDDVRSRVAELDDVRWVAGRGPTGAFQAAVRIRHQHQPAPAVISPLPDNRARVEFAELQWAITPGQAAVFYSGEVVLGGGTIRGPESE